MNETTIPLHSKSTLIKALIGAVVLSSVIYVTVVLPAEYQKDPTGTGKLLGLMVLAQEPATPPPAAAPQTTAPSATTPLMLQQVPDAQPREDETTIVVPARKGIEYKVHMNQYAQITYEWTTDSGELYFDFHGEPKGDTTGYFLSYTIATAPTMKGTMTAPFDGVHGWFWRNTSDNPITVTLKTSGVYQVKGLIR